MTKCRSCGATIEWVRTVDGNSMPIDWPHSPVGNLRREAWPSNIKLPTVYVLTPLEVAAAKGEPLYLSHFATCPNAQAHRNGKARAKA